MTSTPQGLASAPAHPPAARSGPGPSADAAWRRLHAAATAPYRASGRFAWHFARGKLGRDPVFRGMLQRGDLPAAARVVDIGCGQGLLASLLHECGQLQAEGGWPAAWPVRASASAYTGIELMQRDVDRASAAIGSLPLAPRFVCADMREAPLPACDLVVILDVLHYVDHAAQQRVLEGVRAALQAGQAQRQADLQAATGSGGTSTAHEGAPGGRLLLRVGDAASTRGFAVSQWVDRVVTSVRGHRVPPTWGRPVADWVALLRHLGFTVSPVPMSQGTPFANVLLVADLQPATAAQGHTA